MAKPNYDQAQMHELLYQALETEMGGVTIYETAITCAVNTDLKKEWSEYLEQTRTHVQVMLNLMEGLGLDPDNQTPGREVVAHLGESLVAAMLLAKSSGDPTGAELVAGECVVLAETKDHLNWELIGQIAKQGTGKERELLQQAYDAVEQDEDHHLYHTTGWTRELWLESLGLPAVLPPPEEVRQVETKIGAAKAEQSREQMLGRGH